MTWQLGCSPVGAASCRRRRVVVDLADAERGTAFFGWAAPRSRGTIELEAGARHELRRRLPEATRSSCPRLPGRRPPVPAADHDRAGGRRGRRRRRGVVVVGTDDEWETEGDDRPRWPCPATRTRWSPPSPPPTRNTVVVLNTGSPVTMPWLDDVAAVVQLWFPGQELGDALADVLLGVEEPGGRLPVTFPRASTTRRRSPHYPGEDGQAVYAEGLFIGYRWYDRDAIEPLFPFGHGLGYTTLTIEPAGIDGGAEPGVTVAVDVDQHRRAGGQRGRAGLRRAADGDDVRPVASSPGSAVRPRPRRHRARRRSSSARRPFDRGATATGSRSPASCSRRPFVRDLPRAGSINQR